MKFIFFAIYLVFVGCSTSQTNHRDSNTVIIDGKPTKKVVDTSIKKILEDTSYIHNKQIKKD